MKWNEYKVQAKADNAEPFQLFRIDIYKTSCAFIFGGIYMTIYAQDSTGTGILRIESEWSFGG